MPAAPKLSRLAPAVSLALLVLLGGCAAQQSGGAGKFDVDAFLRASDTALPEVLANSEFLGATRASANDCAVMLQSTGAGVLQDLPPASGSRGPAWLLHPAGKPDQVWLIVSEAGGERTCHGPLPAAPMQALVDRAKR